MKDKTFFNIVQTLILFCLLWIGIDIYRALDKLVEDKTLRITSVHHNTTIDNYWGDLPWSEEMKVTIIKSE